MSRVFIETVGCPKNHEDSERMAGLLVSGGHEIVFDPGLAEALIVNTCGFIEAAKRESIETIFDYAAYKEQGKRLIVTGCLAQRYADALETEIPEADALLGVNDYEKISAVVSALTLRGEGEAVSPQLFVRQTAGRPGVLTAPRKALSPRYSSYLKIAEGCSNHCAYCAIPGIRGPYRSMPAEQLLRETETLASEGCIELILIAQDLTFYGRDIYGSFALPELLRGICASEAAKSVEWIRLLYCYEERVTDELIEVMVSEPRILPYIDLPLQHISDGILRRMRRVSTARSIENTIKRLRARMPDIVLRTSFITGLPGESERDFEQLCDFVERIRFDRLGVFAYSPEDGTDAALMPDQVDAETAEARRDELMRLQQRISLERNGRLIGSVQEVLVDGTEGGGVFHGRTRGDAPEIDGEVIFSAPFVQEANDEKSDIIGRFVNVRVTDAMDYDLVGEMVI